MKNKISIPAAIVVSVLVAAGVALYIWGGGGDSTAEAAGLLGLAVGMLTRFGVFGSAPAPAPESDEE